MFVVHHVGHENGSLFGFRIMVIVDMIDRAAAADAVIKIRTDAKRLSREDVKKRPEIGGQKQAAVVFC